MVKWFVHVLFFIQLTYLVCILVTPMMKIDDKIIVTVFLVIFVLREVIQGISLCKQASKVGDTSLSDYFGFWNIMDYINISMMLVYLITNSPEAYSLMALVTWLNLLQYMRLYPFFRFFVDLIKGVILSAETWKFFLVMTIMVMAFASSLFLLSAKKCATDPDCDPATLTENESPLDDLTGLFRGAVYLSFGDFGMDPILDEGSMQTVIFWAAVIIMCLIMLNLLIGILSEAMAGLLATEE